MNAAGPPRCGSNGMYLADCIRWVPPCLRPPVMADQRGRPVSGSKRSYCLHSGSWWRGTPPIEPKARHLRSPVER